MIDIKVALEYFHPWPNSAGFYYAHHQKYFDDVGLRVEFVVTDPLQGDALHYLNAQKVDFAIFPTNRLFVRREQKQPLLGIAAINHTGLEAIQTLKSKNIQRAKDLEHKRIALNPTPRGIAMLKHVIEQDGGDFNTVTLVDAGTREYTPVELEQGLADASFGGYWAWEALMDSPVEASERVVFPISSLAAPQYHSYLLGINEQNQKLDHDIVQKFLKAAQAGFGDLKSNPQLALPIYEKVIPYFPQDLIERSLDRIATSWFSEHAWGIQDEAKHQEYAHWLHEHQIIQNPDIWREATTNRYLQQVASA